jgi:hypothetical protein
LSIHESAEDVLEDGSDSLDNFANQADDEFDSSDDDGENRLGKVNSLKELMAVEFAKAHKLKIEEDMKVIHERHVKLMREMDLNYKMIEQETQDYYIEFLQKWREVAKSKITQYRKQSEQLQAEKETILKDKNAEVEQYREQLDEMLRAK